MLKVTPAGSGHLNKENELVDTAKVTDADRWAEQLTVIYRYL